MGPTNVALVTLFQAEQRVRAARARLDAATRDVRIQERRANDLAERQRLASSKLKEAQSQAGQLDLDLKSRDAKIEKLRTQQQNAKNNKEYQAFLVEINTEKVDRAKVEEEALKMLETVEAGQKEIAELNTQLEAERSKLESMKTQITGKITELQGEIDALVPDREAAAAAVPKQVREQFERLAERLEGEALSALAKPDRRREEYVCTACNMDLVTDIYNKLHSRDELVFCPSCRRILYIPDDLPPEVAVKLRKEPAPKKTGTGKKTAAAEDPIARVLTKAAGESVQNAMAAGNEPGEYEFVVDGRVLGLFKGQSAENLQRTAQFCLTEAGMSVAVQVNEKTAEIPAPNP